MKKKLASGRWPSILTLIVIVAAAAAAVRVVDGEVEEQVEEASRIDCPLSAEPEIDGAKLGKAVQQQAKKASNGTASPECPVECCGSGTNLDGDGTTCVLDAASAEVQDLLGEAYEEGAASAERVECGPGTVLVGGKRCLSRKTASVCLNSSCESVLNCSSVVDERIEQELADIDECLSKGTSHTCYELLVGGDTVGEEIFCAVTGPVNGADGANGDDATCDGKHGQKGICGGNGGRGGSGCDPNAAHAIGSKGGNGGDGGDGGNSFCPTVPGGSGGKGGDGGRGYASIGGKGGHGGSGGSGGPGSQGGLGGDGGEGGEGDLDMFLVPLHRLLNGTNVDLIYPVDRSE